MSERIVMVWLELFVSTPTVPLKQVYARFTSSPKEAIAFVRQARSLGFKCRYEHDFRGAKMSSYTQIRKMYAILKNFGYSA